MPPIAIHVVQHLRPGGIEILALNLLKFQPTAHRMQIVSLEDTAERAIQHWPLLEEFANHLVFLDKQSGWDKTCAANLKHLLQHHRHFTLYTHHIGPLVYGRWANWSLNGKHIHVEHDAWHLQNLKHRWLTKWLLSNKITLVADAHCVAEQIELHLGKKVDRVINNGIDTERFQTGDKTAARKALNLPSLPHWIGCAGRFVPEKGLQDAITALSYLSQDWGMVIAGDGPEREALQSLAQRLQLNDRIVWLGHHNDMPTFYQSLDVFLMPSHQEGAPLALLEAQACGCAIVASNVGAIREFVSNQTGRLVPPEHPRLIAKAVLSVPSPKPTTPFDIRQMVAQYQALR